jgi:beta-lactamase regulating signal transducer with metallopeptidase domain
MDSATRNLLGLLGVAVVLIAYVVCGFVAYILLPFLAVAGRPPLAGTLAAAAVAALLALATARALIVAHHHVRAGRRLAAQIAACASPPTPALHQVAEEMGLVGRIELIESAAPFSFVHGLSDPRVAISRGFLEALEAEELRAVLAHERYHVRKLDPLRATVGATLAGALFLIPTCGALRDRYLKGRELAADRAAAASCGARPLSGALLKALDGPGWREPEVSVSLGGEELLAVRIEHLETGSAPRPGSRLAGLGASIIGAMAFTALYATAIAGLGGAGALARATVQELSLAENLLGAACLAPLAAVVAVGYGCLARRARRAPPPDAGR